MVFAEFGSGQVLWSLIWMFLFIIWLWLLFSVFNDLFRDHALSGWAKAAWCIFVIVMPYLGIFVYLIARGQGMSERTAAAARTQQAAFDDYVRQTVATKGSASPADEIARAKQLLDDGAINQDEFERLKRAALA